MKNTDVYCYPGEDILINKFDCHDKEELFYRPSEGSGSGLLVQLLHYLFALILHGLSFSGVILV